jgi:hypothetical protein
VEIGDAMTYAEWTKEYVAKHKGFVRGKCRDATNKMVKAFPELRQVCGFVYCDWGREQHFWCVAPDGRVIDPTKSQYRAVFDYEELDLNKASDRARIPTGVCMNCGDDVYAGDQTCSDHCYDEIALEYNMLPRHVKA